MSTWGLLHALVFSSAYNKTIILAQTFASEFILASFSENLLAIGDKTYLREYAKRLINSHSKQMTPFDIEEQRTIIQLYVLWNEAPCKLFKRKNLQLVRL